MTIIYVILLFLLMITPHELGHMVVGKLLGFKVNEFAVGMGPRLCSKQGKKTLYSLRALPLGGFCAFEGEDTGSKDPGAFNNRPIWARILVLLAGSAMNIVTAFVIILLVVGISGVRSNIVADVTSDSAAMRAGIQKGDRIVEINNTKTSGWDEVLKSIEKSGEEMKLKLQRDGKEINVTAHVSTSGEGPKLGITSALERSPGKTFTEGIKTTWNMTKSIGHGFYMLVSGKVSLSNVGGPVAMIGMVDSSSKMGFTYVALLIALISINLAILNLLPIPGLDGGRIVILIIKWLTGGRLTEKAEGYINIGGTILLIGLIILVTFKDVYMLFK